jgi:hypothetical protein
VRIVLDTQTKPGSLARSHGLVLRHQFKLDGLDPDRGRSGNARPTGQHREHHRDQESDKGATSQAAQGIHGKSETSK